MIIHDWMITMGTPMVPPGVAYLHHALPVAILMQILLYVLRQWPEVRPHASIASIVTLVTPWSSYRALMVP